MSEVQKEELNELSEDPKDSPENNDELVDTNYPEIIRTDEEIFAHQIRNRSMLFEFAISGMWLIASIILFATPAKYASLTITTSAYVSGILFVLTLFLAMFIGFGGSGAMMLTSLIQGLAAIALSVYILISLINNILTPEWLYLPIVAADLFLIFSTIVSNFMFKDLVSSKLIELEAKMQKDETETDSEQEKQEVIEQDKNTETTKANLFSQYLDKNSSFGVEGIVKAGENSMIVVDNLSKSYGPIKALNNISFSCEKKEIIGFLGPNGAGKSTAMKILTTYLQATSGSAWVAGFNIADEPLEVRRRIGYLPETTPLYKQMKVVDYLKFVMKARRVERKRQMRNLFWVREACGLEPIWNMFIGELSKGFKQRVGLAQAMLHEPEILLLDEPSSGLDPNQIIEIRNLIKQIAEEKTVILSTHILQEVTAICSRVLIVNQGQLVANGSISELTKALSPQGRYIMRIKAPEKKACDLIGKLEGVENVEVVASEKQNALSLWVVPSIEFTENNKLGSRLTQLCVENKWAVNEIKHDYATLEDVFVTLTSSK